MRTSDGSGDSCLISGPIDFRPGHREHAMTAVRPEETLIGDFVGDAVPVRSQRVVTFGEAMIRLTPPGNERLERSLSLDLTIGGAELNTAVGLACLGVPSEWVTALPETGPGRLVARQARAKEERREGKSVQDV